MQRYTIRQFNEDFPDDDACLDYVQGAVSRLDGLGGSGLAVRYRRGGRLECAFTFTVLAMAITSLLS